MKDINFEIKIPELKFSDRNKFRLKAFLTLSVLFAAFFAWENFGFEIAETLILAYFGISLVWSLSGRIAAFFALILLVCLPILLIFKEEKIAENFAVYVYYFLCITVIQEIAEFKKSGKDNL